MRFVAELPLANFGELRSRAADHIGKIAAGLIVELDELVRRATGHGCGLTRFASLDRGPERAAVDAV